VTAVTLTLPQFKGNSLYADIENCLFDSLDIAITSTNFYGNLTVKNSIFRYLYEQCVYIVPESSSSAPIGINFIGCIFSVIPSTAVVAYTSQTTFMVVNLTECLFANNHGSVNINSAVNVIVNDCVFQNSSTIALILYKVTSATISNSSFVGNHVSPVEATLSDITISTSSFALNSVTNGGGLLLTNSSVLIDSCSMTGNSATYGGALYLIGSNANIKNTKMINNTATFGSFSYCVNSLISLTDCIYNGTNIGCILQNITVDE